MRAFLNLRHSVPERRAAFVRGLERHGFTVVDGMTTQPKDRDIFVTWNRIGPAHHAATAFESRRLKVIVAENASWGNDFAGGHWYSLAWNYHNTSGRFPIGTGARWDRLGVDLMPWRRGGDEIVILPQRGIGPPCVAMPMDWDRNIAKATGGRIRPHPGTRDCLPLQVDLARAREVRTWGSGAAIKALLWGVPVVSDMPGWIGQQDNSDQGRLAMFRRLAWAQWRLDEIATGDAFARFFA